MMHRVLRALARAVGYTVEPRRHMKHYAQSEYLQRLFPLLGIDCVFDVGANRGQFHDFLRGQVGYRGWIVSFEPNPRVVSLLRERLASDPRWRVEGHALGRERGQLGLNVMAGDEFSSFLAPEHGYTARFRAANAVREHVQVEVRTLAEVAPRLLEELGCRRPYLKLDTQGYDLEVVLGAGDALERFPALQTEASVIPIYEGSPDYMQVIRELTRLGYELSGVFPNNPAHFPQLVEFDCHLVAGAELRAMGLLARSTEGSGGAIEDRRAEPRP